VGHSKKGFTIVELLIVIVVIAILAAITIVSYNGISNRAKESSAQSGAQQGFSKITAYAIQNGDDYPANLAAVGIGNSGDTTYQYMVNNGVNPRTFCLSTTVSNVTYYVSSSMSAPTKGVCSLNGAPMQTITSANCPTARTRAVDARDNHTYWVQKIADGKCWMLTNLAYAGGTSNGGVSSYGDTKTLSNGTGDSFTTYTVAKYYIPPSGSNITTEPTAPSTSTNGSGQYGYFYNWCGAMGDQQGTDACSGTDTTDINPAVSICPAGWRIPTGGHISGTKEFLALTTALGATRDAAGSTLMQSAWLAQLADGWWNGFGVPGDMALYWASTSNSTSYADNLGVRTNDVNPDNTGETFNKYYGFAVRCIAS